TPPAAAAPRVRALAVHSSARRRWRRKRTSATPTNAAAIANAAAAATGENWTRTAPASTKTTAIITNIKTSPTEMFCDQDTQHNRQFRLPDRRSAEGLSAPSKRRCTSGYPTRRSLSGPCHRLAAEGRRDGRGTTRGQRNMTDNASSSDPRRG